MINLSMGIIRWILVVICLGVAGCGSPGADSGSEDTMAKRFQEDGSEPKTSGESTVSLSVKYAQLADRLADLQQENQQLATANEGLKAQIVTLESQLKQAKAELTEANGLLMDLLAELNKWKTDILGFRNEIRQAEEAQLRALLKILQVLGADSEAVAGPASSDPNAMMRGTR